MAAKDHTIPIEYLRACLAYDPASGELTWLRRPREHFASYRNRATAWNTEHVGKRADEIRSAKGYLQISLKFGGKAHRIAAHRVAWALVTGAWPEHEVDHRNGVRDDNRWHNLREATPSEQHHNQGRLRNNTSGFTGVTQSRMDGRWNAAITINRRVIYLGHFAAPETAFRAYLIAKAEHHPFQPTPRDMGERETAVDAMLWLEREASAIAARREHRGQ